MPDRHLAVRHRSHPLPEAALLGRSGAGRLGDSCNTRTRLAQNASPIAKLFRNVARHPLIRRSQGVANYITVTCVNRKAPRNVVIVNPNKNALAVIARLSGRPSIRLAEAGSILGVSESAVSRRNSKGWDMEELLSLADHYGVSRLDLMLQLGYLPAGDKYEVVGDGSLAAIPLESLVAELERRARAGEEAAQ